MASRAPLISCIMLTRDRPNFVAQAVRCFRRQEHRALELVIVDDGRTRAAVDDDDRIRVIRLDWPHTAGHKRNLACQASRGEFVAHWDDAWHSPRRLRRQLAALVEGRGDVVGISSVLHYAPRAGSVWLRAYARPAGPGVAADTLLYRRLTWQRHPFLLCGEHHRIVDANPRIYSVEVLAKYKADHEARMAPKNIRPVPPPLEADTVDLSLLPVSELPDTVWSPTSLFRTGDEVRDSPCLNKAYIGRILSPRRGAWVERMSHALPD
jgi:glycosyltransferase involved in cell wall biosynthesis